MTSKPLKVLHVLSGLDTQGGIMSFVTRIAAADEPGVQNFIWKHRDFQAAPSPLRFVCQGKARYTDRSLRGDLLGAVLEVRPLLAWMRGQEGLILHAHSRLGIFAGFMAALLTRIPLLIHMHALASRPRLYRMLWRLSRSQPIFNSTKTCRHYGCDPAASLIVMPPINWPRSATQDKGETIRFVACGAFVRGKHFDLLLRAFQRLGQEKTAAELHIYGLSSPATDPACQGEIVASAQANPAVHLHAWDSNWTDRLLATDVFVHLGQPESFALVILEAFARGCKLVVLPGTFLDGLPPPLNTSGVHRAEGLTADSVAQQMSAAARAPAEAANLFELRQSTSPLFSIEASRANLARVYQTLS